MASVSVHVVADLDAAIAFYTERLGFEEVMDPAPTFAMLSRGELRLLLSRPSGADGGGQAMPDGTRPQPGGWNRFSGVGGKQILLDDPSGNPVELPPPPARLREIGSFPCRNSATRA